MPNQRLDLEIARIATRQHGVITRTQLLAMGLGRGGIAGRTRSGRLYVLHAGVYLVGHRAHAPLAREMAAVLACGDGAVVSHRSAAMIWSLPHGARTAQVEVTVARADAPRRPGIRIYGTDALVPRDIRCSERIPVTSPARTLLDLGRFLTVDQVEHVVADAERRGLVRRPELLDQLDRNVGRRGVATLRAVLAGDQEPAFTRSVAERRMLRLLRAASLPRPLINVRIGRFEVDLVWPHEHLIVEVDGFQWHSDRVAFERDRLRDAELQALGHCVIRVTWRQLRDEPQAVIYRITRALGRAGEESSHR